MRFDNFDDTVPVQALVPTAIATNTTTAGTSIKLDKGNSLLFLIYGTTATAGNYLPKIEHSDDGITFTEVNDTLLKGTEVGATLTKDNLVTKIGYLGSKPFVKASLVSTAVVTGGTFGIMAIFNHLNKTDFATQKY